MNYIVRQVSDQQIHLILTFQGRLNEDILAQAVRLSLDEELVLRSRFVAHPRRPYWQAPAHPDGASALQIVDAGQDDASLWRFITCPSDPCSDAVLQLRLFRAATDVLCIKLNHAAGDAAACKDYAYRLAALYRQLSSDPHAVPACANSAGRGQGRSLKAFFWRAGPLALLRAYRQRLSPTPAWGFPAPARECPQRFFAVRRFEPAQLLSIKAYGRRFGATVNDVLIAAFFRAMFTLVDAPLGVPLPIAMTVDMRRYRPSAAHLPIGNFSSSVFPALMRIRDESFEGTLQRVVAMTQAFKAHHPGLAAAVYQEMSVWRGFAQAQQHQQFMYGMAATYGTFYPMFTNFGVIDAQQLDFGTPALTDAYMTSPIFFPPGFMAGVNTYRDRLTLTVGGYDAMPDRELIERFVQLFASDIEATIAAA
jgi:NRPS condensation-like uncharacterized protein